MHTACLITPEIHQNRRAVVKTARSGAHLPANEMLQHHIRVALWWSTVENMALFNIVKGRAIFGESNTVLCGARHAMSHPMLARHRMIGVFCCLHYHCGLGISDRPSGPGLANQRQDILQPRHLPETPDMILRRHCTCWRDHTERII